MDTQAEKTTAQLFNEAVTLSNATKFAEAAHALSDILERSPDFAPASDALAVVLANLAVRQGRDRDVDAAIANLTACLCLDPGAESPRAMLNDLLYHAVQRHLAEDRLPEAFLALGRTLRIRPDAAPWQQNIAMMLLSINSYSAMEGMSWAQKVALTELVLEREPDERVAQLVHMVVSAKYCLDCEDSPELERAIAALRRAAGSARRLIDEDERAGTPVPTTAIYALAAALARHEEADLALDLEKRLDSADPSNLHRYQNMMFSSLCKGDLETAWCAENWNAMNRACLPPMWDGHSRGTVIHLVNNNGLGDFLQSIRHIRALSAYFDEILIWDRAFTRRKHRAQMSALLARSGGFEKVQLRPGAPRLTSADIYCELFALPFALHATRADYSGPAAYLSPDPELVARWSALIRKPGRVSVAFSWSSGGDSEAGRRNIGLENMARLFECHDRIDFYSINNTNVKLDLFKLDLPPNVTDLGIVDLDHMAAILNVMDVVLAPDGGLAHLAGATGAKLWIGVHRYSDWRWGLADKPLGLYGGARVFRQPSPGDWRSVCDNIEAELVALADAVAPETAT